MKWKSNIKKTDRGMIIISYVHEIDISLALEELDYSLEKYGNIKIEYIEGMINDGYNLEFLYYDYDFSTNLRVNND
tara:strand:- start:206 stop:433 length:228 start_codon:yes stop_codon:yes gene_type:complete